ncbi:serine/threonine protein kinase [Nonomuraea insulae]|uniref:non-specific serine/threonine protein kinase n=1 Tax=Nonomuraea insulae TaxID=1616787 RepID=A0ABW1D377_9ACTN
MPDLAALRPGDPATVGGYGLSGRLGEGGQGIVYLATARDGTKVALKLLRSDLAGDAEASERFVREVAMARRVAPFCTAQVVETGLYGGRPYIVSEYIDGPTLTDVVREQGPRSGTSLHRLAIGTVTALVAIHQAGIVHRDFKPSNVVLASDGPRVIDFGIAKALDRTSTLTGAVIGTPSFMAPEQLTESVPGPKADLFAWACTLLFAASGRPPFGQDSVPAVVNRILHAEADVSTVADPALRALVVDCLAKDPARRPSADEALMRLLGHTPAPHPPGRTPTGQSPALLQEGSAAAASGPARHTSGPVPPASGPLPPASGAVPPASGPQPRTSGAGQHASGQVPHTSGPVAPASGAGQRGPASVPRTRTFGPPAQGSGPPAQGSGPPAQGSGPHGAGSGPYTSGSGQPAQGPVPHTLWSAPHDPGSESHGPGPGSYGVGSGPHGVGSGSYGTGSVQHGPGSVPQTYPQGPPRPGQPATRRRTGWIVTAAVAGALTLAAASAFVAVRLTSAPGPTTSPSPSAAAQTTTPAPSTTAAPSTTPAPSTPTTTAPPATRSITLPGTSVRVEEHDADPIKLASYTLDSGKRLYVKKHATGAFALDTRYFEYALSPGGDQALGTDVDYTTDLFATVSIIDHATDEKRVVKLSPKPIYPTTPRWSPDGRYGLVTLYKGTAGDTAEYGFGIIDVAAGKGRAFEIKDKGAGRWRFFWDAGGEAVGTWVGSEMRFYDLDGKLLRTLSDVGSPVWVEGDDVSPSGTRFLAHCTAAGTTLCARPTSGDDTGSVTVPFTANRLIGWWDDEHLAVWRTKGSGYEAVVVDLSGEVSRVLATAPQKAQFDKMAFRFGRVPS